MSKNRVNLGKIIDVSAALEEDASQVVPGRKPSIKVYPPPKEGAKDPLGKRDKYQETSPPREEYTKG